MFKKIFSIIILIILFSFSLMGCLFNESKETVDDIDNLTSIDNDINQDNINNKKLNQYFIENKDFFINMNDRIIYNGYCEYGYTLEKPKVNQGDYILEYSGKMTDGYGEDERGERRFKLSYIFKLDEGGTPMVYDEINNLDYMNKNKNMLNSIIKNYIVILGEPMEGKYWEQDVQYKGKEYKAKTIMKNVSNMEYTLATTITNIEGFYQNNYKEERVYKKGLGLVRFNNSPVYEVESTIGDGSDLIFGYNLNEEASESR